MIDLASAAERFAAGSPVLVGDNQDETIFLALSAAVAQADQLDRLQTLARGGAVLGLAESDTQRLQLAVGPRLAGQSGLRLASPINAATGIGDGWSLEDRARTMRVAASPGSGPQDLVVPGHVLTARIGALDDHCGAAAMELALTAELPPAVALCAVLDSRGTAVGLGETRDDPGLARLPHVSAAELRSLAVARQAARVAVACELPTRHGVFRAIGFEYGENDTATVALIHGDLTKLAAPLVHVHVACRLGDAFGSLACDCRTQLDAAISEVVADGAGVIIYAQPGDPGALICARDEPIDVALVSGLLRAAGVTAVRPTARALPLARDLRNRGLEVAA